MKLKRMYAIDIYYRNDSPLHIQKLYPSLTATEFRDLKERIKHDYIGMGPIIFDAMNENGQREVWYANH